MCKNHGVSKNLNCMICNPSGPINKCTCNFTKSCDLCKVFVPLCNEINDICEKITNFDLCKNIHHLVKIFLNYVKKKHKCYQYLFNFYTSVCYRI